jgi:hypothetical protein
MKETLEHNNKEMLKEFSSTTADEFNNKLDNETKLNYFISVLNDYMVTKQSSNNNYQSESPKFLKNHDEKKPEVIETVLDSDDFRLFAFRQYKLLIYRDNEILEKNIPNIHVYKMSDNVVSSCLRKLFKLRNY